MYKFAILLTALALFPVNMFGQSNNVGIGTTNPEPSAKLEVNATDQGMLVPRMTELEKNAISNPATALLIYQMDADSGFHYFDGTTWLRLGSGIGGSGSGGGFILSPLKGWSSVSLASTAEAYYYRIILLENATVSELVVAIENVQSACSQTFEFGIYESQTLGGDRRPFNQLVSKTEVISGAGGPGSRTIAFPTPVNLSAGEVYWVAMMRTGGTTFCINFSESIEVKPRREQGLAAGLPATAGSTSGVSIPNVWFGLR